MTPNLLTILVAREKIIRTGRSPTASTILAEVGSGFSRAQIDTHLSEIKLNLARPPLIKREPAYANVLTSIQEMQVVLTAVAPAELIEEIQRLMLHIVPELELKNAQLEDQLAQAVDLNRDYFQGLKIPPSHVNGETNKTPTTIGSDDVRAYESQSVTWQTLWRMNAHELETQNLYNFSDAPSVGDRTAAMMVARAEQSKRVLRSKIACLNQEIRELKAINTQLEALIKKSRDGKAHGCELSRDCHETTAKGPKLG